MKNLVLFLSLAIGLVSCGPSTRIASSWRDPGVTVDPNAFNKVLCAAFVQDETNRRVVEDELVKRLKGKGVASYTLNLAAADSNNIEAKLKEAGFDGIIIMRLAAVEKETNYVPGSTGYPYYGGYRGYYGYAYGAYSTPGYYTEDKIFSVETNFYSVKTGKLMWSAKTETTNPSKTSQVTNEIADVITEKMISEGFLKR
jgi:hypothetical protein